MHESEIVGKFLSTLPEDDDHPYRTGPWRPQTTEWDADDLTAVEGEIPRDLDGVYLRNTENPLHPSLKFYHPFDGDGMIHIVGFRDGKAFYRNRFVRTDGLPTENEAGGALWPGLAEPVQIAKRDHGWGARTLMKDASSTDVIVHRGTALTSFYQCGDLYRVDPFTAETLGKEDWNGALPVRLGRVGASEGRRRHRRVAVLQLQQAGAVHALRRGRRQQRPGAPHRHPAAGSAAAARHGVHPELRHSQRLSAVLGSQAAGGRHPPARVPPRHAVAVRRHPPPRRTRRHPVVRGRPDVRAALHQRLRGRRRDRARRVLRGRPCPGRHRSPATSGRRHSGSSPSTGCRPGCTAGGSTSSPAQPAKSS